MESGCLWYLPVVGTVICTSEPSTTTSGPKSETLWGGGWSLGVEEQRIP